LLRTGRRPRGFGFIEFVDERDADDAMNALDGRVWGGREITVRCTIAGRAVLRGCCP